MAGDPDTGHPPQSVPSGYAVFPAIWLVTLLAAMAIPNVRTLGFAVSAWVALDVSLPQSGVDPRWVSAIVLLPQIVMVMLVRPASRQISPCSRRAAFVTRDVGEDARLASRNCRK